MEQSSWDFWVEEALLKVESLKLLRPIRPIQLSKKQATEKRDDEEYEVFNELQPWDRSTVEVSISESFFQQWLRGRRIFLHKVNSAWLLGKAMVFRPHLRLLSHHTRTFMLLFFSFFLITNCKPESNLVLLLSHGQ